MRRPEDEQQRFGGRALGSDDELTTIDPMREEDGAFPETSRTLDPTLARAPDQLGLHRFTTDPEQTAIVESGEPPRGPAPEGSSAEPLRGG